MAAYRKPRQYKKSRRKVAATEAAKAKLLQGAYRRATDRKDTLTMADAKLIVNNPPDCPYCRKPIPYKEISIDHVQPRSKGGSSTKENLVYCDRQCNMAKGDLTGPQFTDLMDYLSTRPEKDQILRRLIAGSTRIYGRRRR